MINQLTVLNTVQDNGADVMVDSLGLLNITGADSFPANSITNISKYAYQAEQLTKVRLTFTSVASTTYTLTLSGYNMQTGIPFQQVITYTSAASTSSSIISAAVTALINAIPNGNITATDSGSGVVDLIGKTATNVCPNAPLFTVKESDSNIAVTAPLTVSFTAAPTGGRTAKAVCVVSDAGALSSLIITDPGEGYITAPTATFAGGGGSSAAATMMIFEGQVVGTSAVTAGSGYVARVGLLAQGTYNAIRNKYNVGGPYDSNATPIPYAALNNLESGSTYDEYVISYNLNPPSGNTTFTSLTDTNQVSIIVKRTATNASTLIAFWGTLDNLQKGYKCWMSDSGVSNTVALTAATGALAYTAGGSPAFGAVSLGIMPNDILVIGTGVVPSASAGGVVRVSSSTSNTAGLAVFGGGVAGTNVSADVYKVVRRRPISL